MIFFVGLIFWNHPHSQASNGFGWQPVMTDFLNVKFVDANTVFIVGSRGIVMKSTDAGLTWKTEASGVGGRLTQVTNLSILPQNSRAVKIFGYVWPNPGTYCLQTENGGFTWEFNRYILPCENISTIHQIYSWDGKNAWALGDYAILRTSDGGENWNCISNVPNGGFPRLFALNDSVAWGYDDFTITRTMNRGLSWTTPPNGLNQISRALYFINPLKGWTLNGAGSIKTTSNGGNTWTQISNVFSPNNKLKELLFLNQSNGLAYGDSGTIFRTSNGGVNWVKCPVETKAKIYSMTFGPDQQTGLAVGQAGTILRTTDGGLNWTTISSGPLDYIFRSLCMFDSLNGLVACGSDLYKTTDGGNTWNKRIQANQGFEVVKCVNEKYAWAIGPSVRFTKNKGESWETRDTGIPDSVILNEAFFIDSLTGWIGGYTVVAISNNVWKYNTYLFRTLNGGITWDQINTGQNQRINSIQFLTKQVGFIAGIALNSPQTPIYGIFKTVDGGQTWSRINQNMVNFGVHDMVFLDSLRGKLITYSQFEQLYQTKDGGVSWSFQGEVINGLSRPRRFFALDSNHIWMGGPYGFLAFSSDNGNTWTQQIASGEGNIRGIKMHSPLSGIAYGENSFMTTYNGGTRCNLYPVLNVQGDTVLCHGDTITLSSSPGDSYTWFHNGYRIEGETGQNLVARNEGRYSVSVKIGKCVASAKPFVIRWSPAIPKVVTSDGDNTLCFGDTAKLSSSGSASFQWMNNNSPLIGATDSVLMVSISGNYAVQVTDSAGCKATSDTMRVNFVEPPPTPTLTPGPSISICAGDSIVLESSAVLGLSWYRNDTLIQSAVSPSLKTGKPGNYHVTVTRVCTRPSSDVEVLVTPLPIIVQQPQNQALFTGDTARFQVTIEGTGLEYQWQVDSGMGYQNLTNQGQVRGAQTNQLAIQGLSLNNNNEKYQCLITANACQDTSDFALLTVITQTNSILRGSDIQLKPNPTSGLIYLSSDQKITKAVLKNSLGQVQETVLLSNKTMDLGPLPAGFYWLSLSTAENHKVIKVVRE